MPDLRLNQGQDSADGVPRQWGSLISRRRVPRIDEDRSRPHGPRHRPVSSAHDQGPAHDIAERDPEKVMDEARERYRLGMLGQKRDAEQGHIGDGMLEAAADEG